MNTATMAAPKGNLTHKAKNDQRLDDLLAEVREFGRDSAAGKDSLPKLALKAVRAAADGVISTTKDKDGNDDATRIFEEYTKAEGKKAIHERTAAGKKANVSKLRQLIKMGELTTCDPVEVLNRAVTKREELQKADANVKLRPAYASFVEVAREQCGTDTEITDEVIEACVRKPEPSDRTVEEVLERVCSTLEGLITGEGRGGIKDQSPEVIEAHDQIKKRLASLLMAKEEAEIREKARALGLQIAEDKPAEVPAEVPAAA